ncbi:MAG: serine hydrolase domain-containing protein [Bacteroidota bacterium]
MKNVLFWFIGLAILSCNSNESTNSDQAEDPIQMAIKEQAESLLSDPKINAVSIGIYKNKKDYTAHFGELDKGEGNVPTDEAIYEIASVSKSFTGTLVAQAVVDKKLSLEDDVRKYLEGDYTNLEYEGNPIRVRHLVTHTAGLPRFFPDRINDLFNTIDETLPFRIYEIEKDYSKEEFLTDLSKISIDIVPGTSYRYSNADVELMAHILEKAYQMPYERLLEENICKKAGMNNTKVHLSEEEVDLFANGYGETNQLVPHFANTLWGAGSGIKSTTADLIKYMKFQLDDNNTIVAASHESLYADANLEIAYLWPIENNAEDGIYYNIHGGAFGTQNYLMIVPKYQLGISIITNQSGPETQGKLMSTLENLLEEVKNIP